MSSTKKVSELTDPQKIVFLGISSSAIAYGFRMLSTRLDKKAFNIAVSFLEVVPSNSPSSAIQKLKQVLGHYRWMIS